MKSVSATNIENAILDIRLALELKEGCRAADRLISPLTYYIFTGRAPVDFLRWFVNEKPATVARILAKGGADEAVIRALKAKAERMVS